MIPTADQVAHAIVAASRHFDADPILVIKRVSGTREYIPRSRALIYAMMAIADLWGNDAMAARLLTLTESRASSTRWQIEKRALKWWDPKVLVLVKAAIPDPPASPPVRERAAEAPTLPAARETAPPPRAASPAALPARRTTPNFGTVPGMGPPRAHRHDPVGEKARLREELRQALERTAQLPSQNG